MGDTKMLQSITDGQGAIKEQLLDEVGKVRLEIRDVKKEVVINGKRIDKIGLQLARLENLPAMLTA